MKKNTDNIDDVKDVLNELSVQNKQLLNKVEEQRKELKEKVLLISNNIIYSSTDLAGNITDASDAFCKVSGYSREELIGSSHNIIRHPDTPSETFREMWSSLLDNKVWQGQIQNKRKDGSSYWVYSDIRPEYDLDGEKIGYMSVRSDITDKIRNQRHEIQILEQSKMAAMGSMIGHIAHQWRQPLNVISTIASGVSFKKEFGSLELEELSKEMDEIVNHTIYLSNTIDTFRNFLKEKKELKEICIQDRIQEVLHILSATIKNNDIKLINNTKDTSNIIITMVSGELEQVFINIINNAKDVMLEKDVDNRWIQIDMEESKNKIIISIEDNGGGIPDDVMPRVFEEYFTTKDESHGTGLGLYMSYKIVCESLGGKIYVKNTNNGAKFYIELPLN